MSQQVDVFPFSFLLHDWRLSGPTSVLDRPRSIITGRVSDTVPLIRLYGYSCPLGSGRSDAKTCVINLHGYFPKLFMDAIPGVSVPDLAEMIDLKLGSGSQAIVYNITELERTNFYGYHEHSHPVVAVELFRPLDVAKLAEFASNQLGVKVYEVHIPYTLQFLVEYSIQGVTPFWIDPAKIQASIPKSTNVGMELSISPDAIIFKRSVSLSQAGTDYPVPPPLASSSCDSQDLVCEVLQSLWEEEFQRTPLGEPFPYKPEGVVDGIDRPDCTEMPWVNARRSHIANFVQSISQPSSVDSQGLAEGFGDLIKHTSYDLSYEDVDEEEDSIEQLTPTLVVSSSTTSGAAPTLVQESIPEAIEPIEKALKASSHQRGENVSLLLPNNKCVIKFTAKAPLGSVCTSSSIHQLSLSGTQQVVNGPQRLGNPIPVTQSTDPVSELTFLNMAVIEILTDTNDLVAIPRRDCVLAIAMKLIDERTPQTCRNFLFHYDKKKTSVVLIPENTEEIFISNSESEMLLEFQQILNQTDPHVLLSWDCSRSSVGYLSDRVETLKLENCRFGRSVISSSAFLGRLSVDLWRVLRNDAESGLKLGTTTLEGVAHSVLGVTVSSVPDRILKTRPEKFLKLFQRVVLVAELAEATRVMPRATEMARLYGMDLESTFTRGSQFRVECMLVRASRRSGFLLPSSSKEQVRTQSATEGIPMVLEPVSGFITDPVCVFDFQSLYPSLVIAYNICFSTCLGRLTDLGKCVKLGTQSGFIRPSDFSTSDTICLPSQVGFVQKSRRLGLLPRICHEILQTRLMVKKSSSVKSGRKKSLALLKQLDARQLSLKLLANVIYGYTTASFSGRMPCAEIADAIVLTGRESLEHVMRMAEKMGGKIVYGDTDSLFVQLPKKSVREAFAFGSKLVEQVNQEFPWPMKLIHEKVYWPCCLVTKKRYVGRAFDSMNSEPRLDAKGIETIRRDTCPAVAVTVERILNEMFDLDQDKDLNASRIKILGKLEAVCIKEFSRILKGALPLKFFVFQNQVRQLSNYKDMQHLPPAARVAVDSGRIDTAKGERIAYVITQGELGSKLSEQVKPPSALAGGKAHLNLEYYVTKQVIPAVQRIFGPLANRAFTWLSLCSLRASQKSISSSSSSFTVIKACLLCSAPTASSLFKLVKNVPLFCASCMQSRTAQSIAIAGKHLSNSEKRIQNLKKLCLHCSGPAADACTDAYHCEVYFQKIRARSSNVDQSRYSFSENFW